jgi:hypothetical protein
MDGLEVVVEQISPTELLLRGEILFAHEHASYPQIPRTKQIFMARPPESILPW